MTVSIRDSSVTWLSSVGVRANAALAAIRRQPHTNVPHPGASTIALFGVTFAVAFALLMVFADARAIIWARGLPRDLVTAFRAITDFGKAAWFLYPLPALMVLLLLLPARLPRAAQATFGALFARI